MDGGSAAPRDKLQPMLIIFGGLSGTGKTTVARELARQLGAVYLRIDSIEQAIRDSGGVNQPVVKQPIVKQPIYDAGYRVGYAVAEDNLRLGLTVVADSVNPLQITRDAWIGVANRAHVNAVEVEAVCSHPEQHQLRVETRVSDIEGLRLPTWQEVVSREYEPWDRPHILIDTTTHSVAENLKRIREALSNH
jgi:predicted kinase